MQLSKIWRCSVLKISFVFHPPPFPQWVEKFQKIIVIRMTFSNRFWNGILPPEKLFFSHYGDVIESEKVRGRFQVEIIFWCNLTILYDQFISKSEDDWVFRISQQRHSWSWKGSGWGDTLHYSLKNRNIKYSWIEKNKRRWKLVRE